MRCNRVPYVLVDTALCTLSPMFEHPRGNTIAARTKGHRMYVATKASMRGYLSGFHRVIVGSWVYFSLSGQRVERTDNDVLVRTPDPGMKRHHPTHCQRRRSATGIHVFRSGHAFYASSTRVFVRLTENRRSIYSSKMNK